MIERTVEEMYRDDDDNRFLEVTYQNGDKEVMYFKDFSSGAMIENIVRRAKKLAIKRAHRRRGRGASAPHDLLESIQQEYKEHEDLPNTTNPDDWAKISGKKGERIVYVRTLMSEGQGGHRRPGHRAGRHRAVPVAVRYRPRERGSVAPWRFRKVCGIETEYGIVLRGAGESNPIAASSVLINAYVGAERQRQGRAGTSRTSRPGNDARGLRPRGRRWPPEVETHLVNAVLTNGARYYVDHAHPEFSTPECADALEVVLWDKAGERILARVDGGGGRDRCPTGQEIVVYKNNSDRKGNSYGCHENYLMDRAVPFGRIVQHVMPHFVTRQIFTGAGKVGYRGVGDRRPTCRSSSPSGPTSSRRRSASRPR